jgi:hypothetical protein
MTCGKSNSEDNLIRVRQDKESVAKEATRRICCDRTGRFCQDSEVESQLTALCGSSHPSMEFCVVY